MAEKVKNKKGKKDLTRNINDRCFYSDEPGRA